MRTSRSGRPSTPPGSPVRDGFGTFILSHGRPEQVHRTIDALTRARYTGPWWIVLDDEDPTAGQYTARWGADRIVTFNKDATAETFDLGDNAGPRSVVVYARNAVDPLAAGLGLTHYLVLDDDYTYFAHRFVRDGSLDYAYTYRLDAVLEACLDFLDASGALTVAFAQGGDYLGGVAGTFQQGVKRKAMNTFLVRTGHPIGFVGRINEDTTTYTWRGSQGDLFLTLMDLYIDQRNTQEQEGGLTGAYLDLGTYAKSFYTVMWAPSCTRISTLGDNAHRVHHRIAWGNAVPKIISSRHRQERPAHA